MKNYKIGGYAPVKKFTIELLIFLLKDAVPIWGAAAVTGVVSAVVWRLLKFGSLPMMIFLRARRLPFYFSRIGLFQKE